jgi:UDP-GlcNAc:undecaprenyl-phosphate/decaprenyl-phosphate GlcNAc-1-phosphate transferase
MDELDALWAFLVAALIAFAATPPVARLARRLGVIHRPRDRDLHDRPVPGLGGLAILAAVIVSALLFLPAGGETRGIIGGALAISFVGAVDDWREGGLHPAIKLAGQFAAGAIPVAASTWIT